MKDKQENLKSACRKLAVASLIGTLISVYGFYVEFKAEDNHDYKAMCDINEVVSCTKVFSTEYGKGFGVVGKVLGENSSLNLPNGAYGLIFYVLMYFMSVSHSETIAKIQLGMAVASNILSIYLACLLIFVIKYFCVVCVSLYVVNFFLFVFAKQKNSAIHVKKRKLN